MFTLGSSSHSSWHEVCFNYNNGLLISQVCKLTHPMMCGKNGIVIQQGAAQISIGFLKCKLLSSCTYYYSNKYATWKTMSFIQTCTDREIVRSFYFLCITYCSSWCRRKRDVNCTGLRIPGYGIRELWWRQPVFMEPVAHILWYHEVRSVDACRCGINCRIERARQFELSRYILICTFLMHLLFCIVYYVVSLKRKGFLFSNLHEDYLEQQQFNKWIRCTHVWSFVGNKSICSKHSWVPPGSSNLPTVCTFCNQCVDKGKMILFTLSKAEAVCNYVA